MNARRLKVVLVHGVGFQASNEIPQQAAAALADDRLGESDVVEFNWCERVTAPYTMERTLDWNYLYVLGHRTLRAALAEFVPRSEARGLRRLAWFLVTGCGYGLVAAAAFMPLALGWAALVSLAKFAIGAFVAAHFPAVGTIIGKTMAVFFMHPVAAARAGFILQWYGMLAMSLATALVLVKTVCAGVTGFCQGCRLILILGIWGALWC